MAVEEKNDSLVLDPSLVWTAPDPLDARDALD